MVRRQTQGTNIGVFDRDNPAVTKNFRRYTCSQIPAIASCKHARSNAQYGGLYTVPEPLQLSVPKLVKQTLGPLSEAKESPLRPVIEVAIGIRVKLVFIGVP